MRLRARARRLADGTLAATLLAAVLLSILVWDVSWWQAVVFGLGPDLAVLFGIAPALARGQLHPRAKGCIFDGYVGNPDIANHSLARLGRPLTRVTLRYCR